MEQSVGRRSQRLTNEAYALDDISNGAEATGVRLQSLPAQITCSKRPRAGGREMVTLLLRPAGWKYSRMKRIGVHSLSEAKCFPPYPVGRGLPTEAASCASVQRASNPSADVGGACNAHAGRVNGIWSAPPYLFATWYAIGPPTSERPRTRSYWPPAPPLPLFRA